MDHLVKEDYRIIKHIPGTSQPLIDDKTGKVFAVVVSMEDPTYIESAKRAFEFIDGIGQAADFTREERTHRRGQFAHVNYGVSYGQGSQKPHWLRCSHEDVMRMILSNIHVIRLATFASYAFSMWAPNVFNYYRTHLDALYQKMPELKWSFCNSIWLCMTINFGPNVCCLPHRDFLNLPFGWCAIHALGDFDYTLGGHLVLPDLRIAIEFPPGSLILLPSALLTHANTPVRPGERRISFTQFCSGGLFRFIENGFQTEEALKKTDGARYKEMMEAKAGRRDMGVGLWSTLEELLVQEPPDTLAD